jgi:hypothetical protein
MAQREDFYPADEATTAYAAHGFTEQSGGVFGPVGRPGDLAAELAVLYGGLK